MSIGTRNRETTVLFLVSSLFGYLLFAIFNDLSEIDCAL